jgi:hypothetical protein
MKPKHKTNLRDGAELELSPAWPISIRVLLEVAWFNTDIKFRTTVLLIVTTRTYVIVFIPNLTIPLFKNKRNYIAKHNHYPSTSRSSSSNYRWLLACVRCAHTAAIFQHLRVVLRGAWKGEKVPPATAGQNK